MLRLLDSAEFRHFIDFVKSPFFNKNKKLIKLTEHLFRAFPDFSEKKMKKEVLFKVLFGKEEKFNEQQVHDHFSMLVRLMENFLSQIGFQKDEIGREIQLLGELKKRNSKF